MFLMSNSTKICNVFNKYKSKIVQLNFKIIQYRFHPLWS